MSVEMNKWNWIKNTNGRAIKDHSGRKFGRLTPILPVSMDRFGRAIWLFLCDCGKIKAITIANLSSSHTQSCGCLQRERLLLANTTHGASRLGKEETEYRTYRSAKQRCNNPKNKAYPYYGGGGIQFKFDSYSSFLQEVGKKPSALHSLDRINVNGNYEAGNVRWATRLQQGSNRRSKREIMLQSLGAICPR